MSLLLEALRRAEEDAKKRKPALASASVPAPVTAPAESLTMARHDAPRAELTLEEQSAEEAGPAAFPAISRDQPKIAQSPETTDFPDLAFVSAETLAAPVARQTTTVLPSAGTATQLPYAKYARPNSSAVEQAPDFAEIRSQAEREARVPVADSVTPRVAASGPPEAVFAKPVPERIDVPAPIPATTHRQAMSAAGVMAGPRQRKISSAEQRRKWVLAAVALVLAVPVAALLLFGNFFSTLPARGLRQTSRAPRRRCQSIRSSCCLTFRRPAACRQRHQRPPTDPLWAAARRLRHGRPPLWPRRLQLLWRCLRPKKPRARLMPDRPLAHVLLQRPRLARSPTGWLRTPMRTAVPQPQPRERQVCR